MKPTSVRRKFLNARLLTVVVLVVSAGEALADPAYIPPWKEGYARSEVMQRRLSHVLDNLLASTRANAKVHAALKGVSLRTPLVSEDTNAPNAYATQLRSGKLVVFESRFAGWIGAGASAGAYYAWFNSNTSVDRICKQFRDDHEAAKARGVAPVFYAELESFPESADPVLLRVLQRLQGMIADETMVWFLLHEAGHIALSHGSGLPPSDSQKQEAAADRWASQTMLDLGYGLFGPSRFLAAEGIYEMCLIRLGYPFDEKQSTHPSWMDRSHSMHQEFDVVHTGRGSPRSFVLALPSGDAWYHIAEADDDSESISGGIGPPFRVAAEWQGRALNVYGLVEGGRRFVLRIPDAHLALLDGERTVFDSSGGQVSKERFTALQLNPGFLDWLEVSPGVRIGDINKKSVKQSLADALTAAGVDLVSRGRILLAFRNFRRNVNDAMTPFLKGEISKQESMQLAKQAFTEYSRELKSSMSESQRAVFDKSIDSHAFSAWSLGHDAAYYQNLEKQLIERNFRDGR